MTDTEDEGVFRWLNGAPLTYSVWGGREPMVEPWRITEDCQQNPRK